MAKITIFEPVHVDIRIDGETISSDLAKGNHEVDQHIADLLIAQGVATFAADEPAPKSNKKTSAPAADTTPTETSEA